MFESIYEAEEIKLTTKQQAHQSGKRAADRLYILRILDQVQEDIDKIKKIMLHDDVKL